MHVYKVYDDKDNLVFTGSANQVCYEFHIANCSMYAYYCLNSKIGGIYRVERIKINKETGKEETEIRESKENKTLKYLKTHLERYGNTVYAKKNPEIYLEMLKKEGINCRARKVADIGGKRKTYYYIFEVVNGTETKRKSV